ncbi:cell division ATP-binding protein FtsE [Stagnimonas aquatica]|jgi:cell division transport system ATP-binding protein|uniref:Cell division ATP-binding protein FtsE n=1 Tax=Stagnimonas aquatica TaxID=2689987 RepID=A0A3N0V7Q2_9GAMM|nr:cell division ATP-binding protein FtsE [Stagnimonas aquatica]ROH88715.1 cell division ATP-binding protein FtsE [Stagnimonas aquatica]TAJ51891.1 MAG: cell division ATP-binding protein FtsE [Nevskiaceae bacterium]TAM25790.1 MAG: cell division ATP-binding protein FtsE [Nevskiaceae bacterium]
MPDIIHFHRVSHRYEGSGDVLSDVTFTLAKGEMAFLTGPSGAGKSTLLKLVALLERPSRGQIVVNGQNLAGVRRGQIPAFRQQIGVVFQNFNLLYDRSVFDNVALPLVIRGIGHDDIGRRVRAALDAVGLLGKEKVSPITLSGGEQQRVGIARAIVAKPQLLLADEPTGNLDPEMAREVMQLFQRFNEVGVSVLVATHAVGLIKKLPYRVIHLERGQLTTRQSPELMEKTVDFG